MTAVLNQIAAIFEFAFPILEHLPGLRAFLGFALMFFVPGYAWTLVFFKGIHLTERIALSIALSIALVTLTLLASNKLLGIRITGVNSAIIIIAITIIPLAIYALMRLGGQSSENSKGDKV